MTATRRIRAVAIDLDDTLISAYRRPDLAWRRVCQLYQTELGDLAPDHAARALTEAGRAFWSDPESHAIGRGARFMSLDTAEPATELIATYTRWGYAIVERTQWKEVNYPSVIMRRSQG